MSTMTEHMLDHPVHMEDLMNLNVDPDAAMVDPQLVMPYFGSLSGKAPEQLTVDPSMWQNPFEPFNTSARNLGHVNQNPGGQRDNIDPATTVSSPSTTPPTHMTGKISRTSSKSSVPSLSSGPTSPGKRTRSKTAAMRADANGPRAKKAKKERVVEEEEEEEDDSKRNKYLERNRIAASKCRQKKKAWVSDLETQKSDLEAIHGNLQREYGSLVDQVTQLKNDLMIHAGCGDRNIDSWIETEAKRFVQRTTDRSDDYQRRLSSSSAGRRPSQSGM